MHYLLVMIVFIWKTTKWEKLMFVCSVTLELLKFLKSWGGYLCEEHGFWGNEIFTHFPCFHSLGIIRSLQSDAFATQNKTALELNNSNLPLTYKGDQLVLQMRELCWVGSWRLGDSKCKSRVIQLRHSKCNFRTIHFLEIKQDDINPV